MSVSVYVVDDDADIVYPQFALLRQTPYANLFSLCEFKEFTTREDEVSRIMSVQPDIVLMDFQLPGTNGADVIRALRAAGYTGVIIGNSGGGEALFKNVQEEIYAYANKDVATTKKVLDVLIEKYNEPRIQV